VVSRICVPIYVGVFIRKFTIDAGKYVKEGSNCPTNNDNYPVIVDTTNVMVKVMGTNT